MSPGDDRRSLCVALHDVAPAMWPACERLLRMLDELGIGAVTLLVVPHYHGQPSLGFPPDFCRAIEQRLRSGDEVALHGFFHLDDSRPPQTPQEWFQRRVLTAAEAEFAAITAEEARIRLGAGLEMLEAYGWPVYGFVAPAWQLGAAARAVLAEFPFGYTTSRTAIWKLPQWRCFRAPSLVYSVRGRARRQLSTVWNERLARRLRDSKLFRVSLHPADAFYPEVVEHWRRLIAAAAQEREAVTKHAWLTRQP